MILTCPSCSATYTVPAEALGERGRDVRCKKCGHSWFQKSEKDSLNELIEKIQATDIPEDDISFGDGVAFAKDVKRRNKSRDRKTFAQILSGLSKSISARFGGIFRKFAGKYLVKLAPVFSFFEKFRGQERVFAGVMLALAVMSVVFYGFVASRFVIVDWFPSMRSLYASAGFPLVSYDPLVKPEDALIIERTQLVKGESGHGGTVTANLINLTSSEVYLPLLNVRMVDSHGQVLKEEQHKLPRESMLKESSIALSFPVPDTVIGSLSTVEISFVKN